MFFLRLIVILIAAFGVSTARAQTSEGEIVTPSVLDWDLPQPIVSSKPLFALRTNLLYDAFLTPNISFEVPIDGVWSIMGEWIFAWWEDSRHVRCYEHLSGEVQARRWFSPHTPQNPMNGWFVGGYFRAGYYDVERRGRGVQGGMWGLGGVGGYTHPIALHLRLEYSISLGVIHTKYNKYDELLDCQGVERLLRSSRGAYTWCGITKVDVSLVWMLYRIKRESR